MKKIFIMSSMLAVFLLMGSMTMCQTGSAAEWRDLQKRQRPYVVVYNCNEWISLRKFPSTEAETLARIPLGSIVTLRPGGSGDFAKVQYRGIEGYALNEYLTRYYLSYQVVNCNEWISLRAAPSVESATLCTIPLGKWVRYVRDADNGFMYVAYGNYIGYALSAYLE